MKRNHFKIGAALASSLVAACGGGGGSGSSPSTLPTVPKSPAGTYATFVVKVPPRAGSPMLHRSQVSRSPHYITSNVEGIGFTVTDATNADLSTFSFFPLTPTAPGCSGTIPSGLTCNVNVIAPPGADTFAVSLYDSSTEPYGAYVISTGTITQTINAGVANTINVVTDGVPTFAIIGFTNPYSSSTVDPLSIDVTDAAGNLIVGSYDAPLTLSNSDTSGATSLSKTSLAQASDAIGVSLNWNGGALASPAIVTLSSNDPLVLNEVGIGTLSTASFMPSGMGVAVSPGIFYFANTAVTPLIPSFTLQNGSTGPVSVTNNCSGYISVSGSYPTISLTPILTTAAVSGGAPAFTGVPGTCQIIFTDSTSHQTAVNALVGQ